MYVVETAFVCGLANGPYDSGQAFLAGVSQYDTMLVSFSAHHSRSWDRPTACGINLDHLVKVAPARFLYHDVTIFLNTKGI